MVDSRAEKYFRALYIGRFQPFHLGHLESVKYILGHSQEIIIMVGSSRLSHTLDNPFTAGERITMIASALAKAGIDASKCYIVPVADLDYHGAWVSHVVSSVPKFDVVYSNGSLTMCLFKEAGFMVKSIPFHKREVLSATEIRKRILSNRSWEHLLSKTVAKFIKDIKGAERLKHLSKRDKSHQ